MVALLAETVTLGDAIRRFRIRAGLSQRSLSEVSGVERSYISMLENSRRSNASYEIIAALAGACGVLPSAIYREAELEMPGPDVTDDLAIRVSDPAAAPFVRRLARRRPEQLRKLEEMARLFFDDQVERSRRDLAGEPLDEEEDRADEPPPPSA